MDSLVGFLVITGAGPLKFCDGVGVGAGVGIGVDAGTAGIEDAVLLSGEYVTLVQFEK